MNIDYQVKYLKYKKKYLDLKDQITGGVAEFSEFEAEPELEALESYRVLPKLVSILSERYGSRLCAVLGYHYDSRGRLMLYISFRTNNRAVPFMRKWVNSKDVTIGRTYNNDGENYQRWVKLIEVERNFSDLENQNR
tara:strand:+ start:264 stop:674 length:411 start_codon:yes stop_codon:yes gene_type:complete